MFNIDKKDTGFIIVDMQKGFLEVDAPIKVPDGKMILPNLTHLINHLRKKEIKIIWTQVSIDLFENTQYKDLFPNHFFEGSSVLDRNSKNYEIIDELKPFISSDDIIIEKDRYSVFMHTNLDLYLKNMNITKLLFAGVTTNVCVESSIRDAFQLGYYTALVSDCTSSFSDVYKNLSIEIIKYAFGYITDSEYIKQGIYEN